jgi:hypothetical protein
MMAVAARGLSKAAWLAGRMPLGQAKYGCAARDSNPEPAD